MIKIVGWLGLLGVGVGGWGWWLTALAASKTVVLLTGLLIAYALKTGWGSVVPASAVVSGAIALVVAFDILPPFWPDNVHYKYWAYTVLALWALSIAIVCLLAKVGQALRQPRLPYRWSRQLGLAAGLLVALWAGTRLYQSQWPAWVPWGL
ncbi:MAG: hypothetical protein WBB18_09650 [Nodosilinea sp.]